MLEKKEKEAKEKSDSSDSDDDSDDSSDSDEDDKNKVIELSSDSEVEAMDTSGPGPSNPKPNVPEEFPDEVTVMTWNVDGLDEGDIAKRFKGVLIIIAK